LRLDTVTNACVLKLKNTLAHDIYCYCSTPPPAYPFLYTMSKSNPKKTPAPKGSGGKEARL